VLESARDKAHASFIEELNQLPQSGQAYAMNDVLEDVLDRTARTQLTRSRDRVHRSAPTASEVPLPDRSKQSALTTKRAVSVTFIEEWKGDRMVSRHFATQVLGIRRLLVGRTLLRRRPPDEL
jgi:hypothetical protein